MAFPQAEGIAGKIRRGLALLCLGCLLPGLAPAVGVARAEGTPGTVSPSHSAPPAAPGLALAEGVDASLSPECRVPGSKMYTLAKLKAVKAALKQQRPVKVLAIGSSSAGLGPSASYPVRLETALERAMPNVDVQIESRGLPGEVARGAAEHLRTLVAEVEPDLVVWQVGTGDALARVEIDAFRDALDETVKWVQSHDIDVVLIDPLYTQSLADDAYYNDMVRTVQEVARLDGVPLVRRYEAMRFLSTSTDKGEAHALGRHFRLNDLGLRCMAEHVARAITLSLIQPDAVGAPKPAAPEAASSKGGEPRQP